MPSVLYLTWEGHGDVEFGCVCFVLGEEPAPLCLDWEKMHRTGTGVLCPECARETK